MNERLRAYKKQKFQENNISRLQRIYPNGIPSDYEETQDQLERDFERFIDDREEVQS